MKHSMEFEIAWQGLKLGKQVLNFEIDKAFMEAQGQLPDDIAQLSSKVQIDFDKHENFFELHFDIDGKIETLCDRCGDPLNMQLWDEFDLIIKLDEHSHEAHWEEDADIVFIPRSETVIDLSKWIYEFVRLSIPLHRVHAENGTPDEQCNPEALKLLDQYKEAPTTKENDIWKDLKSIQNLKKKKD